MEDDNALKNKAEEITAEIIQLTNKSDETAMEIMENLYSFGESIVERTETKGNLTKHIKCSKGCSYCCYAQVSVTPPEAIYIGRYIKENYSLSQTDQLLRRIKHNMSMTNGKSLEERVKVWEQTPCIFLFDGICNIHPVRPFICRAWHSLSVEQCKDAFDSRNENAEIDSYPYRNFILGTIRDGMSEVIKKEGCECEPVEISIAIKAILNHPSPEQSWIDGEKIFPKN